MNEGLETVPQQEGWGKKTKTDLITIKEVKQTALGSDEDGKV